MPFLNPAKVLYTSKDVSDHASTQRGVYAIFDAMDKCLYVGQSSNVRRRLLEHIDGDDSADQCLRDSDALYCWWEECASSGKREKELYYEYAKPPCNSNLPSGLNTP